MVQQLLNSDPPLIKERVHVYHSAVLRGQERVTSLQYRRSCVKDSIYILVRYGEDGQDPYVARVRYFLHIASRCAGVHDLHMAVVDFLEGMDPLHDDDLGTVYQAKQDDWIPDEREYPVHLDAIDCKLVYTKGHIQGRERMLFAPYTIYSGSIG